MSILMNKKLEELRKEAKRFAVTHNSRSYSSKGTRPDKPALIRVVVHKNGNRVELSQKMYNALGRPKRVEMDYTDDFLLFWACESGGFKISYNSEKDKCPIIYCAGLAKSILRTFECNDQNNASHSFCEGELVEDVFLIKVKKRSETAEEASGEATAVSEAGIAETEENFEEEVPAESKPEIEEFEEALESEPSCEDVEEAFEEEPDLFAEE